MQSVQRVVSDGTLQIVDLSITYFDRSEINVFVNAEPYTDWQWASDVEDRIIFNSPIPAGVEVLIKRTTDLSKLRHYFSKGSAFTAEALDEDLQQVLHIAQEATEASLSGDFFTDIDMHGYRVRNIGPAVDDSDALTLRQYKQDAASAWNAKELAVQAQQAAQQSATAAAQSQAQAASYSSSAASYATQAEAYASAAQQAAQEAGIHLDEFKQKYLGTYPSDPTTGPNGMPLQEGMLYFRNTSPAVLRVYSTAEGWKNAPEGPPGPQGIQGPPGPPGPTGDGTGNVLGPDSATAGQLVVFTDVTGTRITGFTGTGLLKANAGVVAIDSTAYATQAALDSVASSATTALNNHANAASAHGAVSTATASRIIMRDSAGRAQVQDPAAALDIANRGWVEGFAPAQAQSAWNAGTSTTESRISPQKLWKSVTKTAKVFDILDPLGTSYLGNSPYSGLSLPTISNSLQFGSLFAIGNYTGNGKWGGGVLATNGCIYFLPRGATNVMYIDPKTMLIGTFGTLPTGVDKWNGGVLAPNGKIYCVPHNTTQVLEIDPETNSTYLFGNVGSGDASWIGAVLAPNGKIYCIPHNATQVLEIDPTTRSTYLFGNISGEGKYTSGVLGKDGKIYGVPFNATSILVIDPSTRQVSTLGNIPGTAKFAGGAIAPNGKIYFAPANYSYFLEVDTVALQATEFGYNQGSEKCNGLVLAPNGKLYAIPLSTSYIFEVDPNTRTVNALNFGDATGAKFIGGVLAPDGSIFFVPFNSTYIGVLRNNRWPAPTWELSPFVNKL